MTRRLCPLALAAAACCSLVPAAHAQNSVQLYGLIDMTAGAFQAPGGERVWRADGGGMTTSFLGFRGTEDLGGGLRAKFVLNHFLRPDSGGAGRFDGDAFWARDAYVGLSGAFGTSTLGRNTTPLFVSSLLFNAFGDSYAFSPTMRQLFTPTLVPFYGDSGWNNSLAYTSNENDGLTVNLIGNLGEGAPGATGKNMGASFVYFNGPLGATAAWQKVRNGRFTPPAGWGGQSTWQVGLSYDLTVAKLFGQYTEVETNAAAKSKLKLWSFGTAVPLGDGKVLAQYAHSRAQGVDGGPTHRTLSVGYDHFLSKRTDVYAVYMNERITGLGKANSAAAGIRMRF